MKKTVSTIVSLLLVSLLCTGCGPSKEEKNEEIRKSNMGDGNNKVDRTPIGGL